MNLGDLTRSIPEAAYEAGERAARPYVTDSYYDLGPAIARDVLHAAAPLIVQTTTVAVLDSLSSSARLVDAVPVNSVADEPCANDWAHGAGTVYGGQCGGLCLPCAVVVVRAAPWDATDPAVVSLDVLRHPAVTR
jgi:hypothetical protein